jgi:hypothetical protein
MSRTYLSPTLLVHCTIFPSFIVDESAGMVICPDIMTVKGEAALRATIAGSACLEANAEPMTATLGEVDTAGLRSAVPSFQVSQKILCSPREGGREVR